MSEDLHLPSAGHSAQQWSELRDSISDEINRQAYALASIPQAERDLDRQALHQLFDDGDFEDFEWAVDWEAELPVFLSQLMHLTENILVDMEMMAMQYPDGLVDLTDITGPTE